MLEEVNVPESLMLVQITGGSVDGGGGGNGVV